MSNQQDAEGQYQTPVSPPDDEIFDIAMPVRFLVIGESFTCVIDDCRESSRSSARPLGLDRCEGVENLAPDVTSPAF